MSQIKHASAAHVTSTKTFHDVFIWFASPGVAPYTDFLVKWGHTLIGLSLIAGLMVRLSSAFGILLMAIYSLAHLDFPYVDSLVNFTLRSGRSARRPPIGPEKGRVMSTGSWTRYPAVHSTEPRAASARSS